MFAVILYFNILTISEPVVQDGIQQAALISFLVKVAIMIALSMLLAPKPKVPKSSLRPVSLEQFDIPTAEEGRPIQVLFGKKYVMAPNVVWYGHLKTQQVMG